MPGALIAILSLFGGFAAAQEAPQTAVVISVAEQKLAILRDGGLVKKYPISTSKYGLGDSYGSYKTPLGKLRVCEKVGDDLALGAVLKQRHATGEVLRANSPGRDPIVTRILWLEGIEAQNSNARARGIYIHGTNEENKIGQPVSYGCIRMRSRDVLEVFDEVPVDAPVAIIAEKLPRFAKYTPPKPPIIAKAPPAPAPTPSSATVVQKLPVVAAAPSHKRAAVKLEPVSEAAAHGAFQGSILMAGLPEGPKLPPVAPAKPGEVPRFSAWASEPVKESAFSLSGISRDLSPAIRAAEAEAAARAAGQPAEAEPGEKNAKGIAFRAAPSKAEQTP